MVSGVKSRPNHYDALGLGPAASDDEIGRAFVKKMSLFGAHGMDEAAHILIAYETLRNAEKRREYDASIGLGTKRVPELRQWSASLAPPRWSPFMASARANPIEAGGAGSFEPHVSAELPGQAPAALEVSPEPGLQQQPGRPQSDGGLEVLVHHIRAVGRQERENLRNARHRAPDWTKPLLAVSGLVLGAGLIGTIAGLSVTDNETPAQAEPARPSAPPKHSSIAARPAIATALETQVERPVQAYVPEFRARRAERQRPRSPVQRESLDVESASGAAPVTQAAQAVAADMPLSGSLVARTIERIGYSCEKVASTSPVEGEAEGVYKVTCSSGQSYQATPVHGRYRFRRLSGR